MTWRQFDSRADISPSALTATDVMCIHETLLGRIPARDEVAQQVAATNDWLLLLEAVRACVNEASTLGASLMVPDNL